MLLTLQRTRHAANIPIGWFAMAIGIAALYVLRFSVRIEAGPAVVGLLAFAIGVSQTRLMAVRGERLITRSPFGLPNSTRGLAPAASNEWTIPVAARRLSYFCVTATAACASLGAYRCAEQSALRGCSSTRCSATCQKPDERAHELAPPPLGPVGKCC